MQLPLLRVGRRCGPIRRGRHHVDNMIAARFQRRQDSRKCGDGAGLDVVQQQDALALGLDPPIEAKGAGILLLHDIQPRTVAALQSGDAESARLSHCPRGAGHAGSARNADRPAAMAIASDIRKRGDFALAQGTKFRSRRC